MLVSRSLDSDADLEVASYRTEVLTLWVDKGDPLVVHGVLLLVVDVGHVKLIHANHLISEHSFVHDFDADRILFDLASVLFKTELEKSRAKIPQKHYLPCCVAQKTSVPSTELSWKSLWARLSLQRCTWSPHTLRL